MGYLVHFPRHGRIIIVESEDVIGLLRQRCSASAFLDSGNGELAAGISHQIRFIRTWIASVQSI